MALLVVLALAACGGKSKSADDGGGSGGAAGAGGTSGADGGLGGTGGNDAANGDALAGAILPGPSRGSPLALSPKDDVAVVVNRDAGTVTVMAVTYAADGTPTLAKTAELNMGAGSEPWQAEIAPDGQSAYVVLRRDQKLVRIDDLAATPVIGTAVQVGSEPTGVALTPTGARAFVANWVDGTVSIVDTTNMTVAMTVDLNSALVATGFLGSVAARPSLAHPRSVAISNNGDASDDDESAYVTEYFAQRKIPEAADASNADVAQVGVVYRIKASTGAVSAMTLAPLADIGFKDQNGNTAGCYPNQLQSITLNGKFAYVTSICASPRGPIGPNVTTTPCTDVTQCAGLIEPACVVPAAGLASVCVDLASTKTTTAPVVSVIDTEAGAEVTAAAASLNQQWLTGVYAKKAIADDASRRYALIPTDLVFVPETGVSYLTANGVDAVFRIVYDPAAGTITALGTNDVPFINLNPAGITPATAGGIGPIGHQITHLAHGGKRFGIVANDISRNVTVLDFNTQAVLGGVGAPAVAASAALPAAESVEESRRRGKKFFRTGLGRWSLKGQGWGSCEACHTDGLTDNVTFYFARGPRQSTSLDGSFASKDPTDQRVLNWTAIFDEVADFENNTRGVSGGVGAIVQNAALATANRIDFAGLGHAGLSGSAAAAADPANPLGLAMPGVQGDWADITNYVKSIRSPRGATNLPSADVAAGKALFAGANCQGCHGDAKWSVSKVFYAPSTATSTALKTTSWSTLVAGFPASVLPAQNAADQVMRFAGANVAGLDQIVCVLRNVGSFGVAEAAVAADGAFPEIRANGMPAQGNEAAGNGFNPPSLLGGNVGGPYLHNGGARTLEALFAEDPRFAPHYRALSPNFLQETGAQRTAEVANLVEYLISIDEDTATFDSPKTIGANGGTFCKAP
ncbi:MAG TPA: hypothetical protein VMU50_10150 [Polyangia bacterium]|nr:hypothetical protein [Polyangia bacterium]